jgi:RNA polymerase sigma-70 factor, ECF subfamily
LDPPSSPDLEALVEQRERLLLVWRCLMRIKPKKRIVYVMYELEGFSGKQIAELLELPEATVRVRLLHARRELVKHLNRALEGKRP